jgi:hypothetical protein
MVGSPARVPAATDRVSVVAALSTVELNLSRLWC